MQEVYARLKDYLQSKEFDYLELLQKMVAINSFTANWQGVNELGRMTAVAFAELGFEVEAVQAENPAYGQHVVLTRHGRGAQKIGLVSHLDTVFPAEEESRHDFYWRPEGQRIYGPGTVDIKGGTAVIFMMMDALKAILPDLFEEITWLVLLNACEEVAEEDFGALCVTRLGQHALACLVFEGGYMHGKKFRTVVVRKGMATFQVAVEGKASHAGSAHEKGANAIVQMAAVIQHIHGLTNYEQALTFNVGTVAGGSVINRVPHQASALVEMRAFDTAVYEQGITEMMALNNLANVTSADGDFTCQVTIEVIRKTPPWPQNEATEKLFAIWQAAGEELGFSVKREERGGLSDGNHIWPYLPTLDGLGPSGGNAHCSQRSEDGSKEQEFVFAPSLVAKALLNVVAMMKLSGNWEVYV